MSNDAAEWHFTCQGDKAEACRKDERFPYIVALGRSVNALMFAISMANYVDMTSKEPSAMRDRMNSYLYGTANMYEAIKLIRDMGRPFKDDEAYQKGLRLILKDQRAVEIEQQHMNPARNAAVFHFDHERFAEAINSSTLNEFLFVSGRGMNIKDINFTYADTIAAEILTGRSSDTNEFFDVLGEAMQGTRDLLARYAQHATLLIMKYMKDGDSSEKRVDRHRSGFEGVSMSFGKCALCHAKAELRDSHYLPRGGYKSARSAALTNQNPVVIARNRAKQSQAQVHEFKFCSECEASFNDGGENWVLRHVHRKYGAVFPIHTILNSAQPFVGKSGFLVFLQQIIPTINIDKLIYFAMSIFWRGTLHWNGVEGNPVSRVYLGRYERQIRMFLLGKSKLPGDMALIVGVWPFNGVPIMSTFPEMDETEPYRRYWFYISGFFFVLAVGKKIPSLVKQVCAPSLKAVILSKELGESIYKIVRTKAMAADKTNIAGMLQEIAAIKAKTSSN